MFGAGNGPEILARESWSHYRSSAEPPFRSVGKCAPVSRSSRSRDDLFDCINSSSRRAATSSSHLSSTVALAPSACAKSFPVVETTTAPWPRRTHGAPPHAAALPRARFAPGGIHLPAAGIWPPPPSAPALLAVQSLVLLVAFRDLFACPESISAESSEIWVLRSSRWADEFPSTDAPGHSCPVRGFPVWRSHLGASSQSGPGLEQSSVICLNDRCEGR